MLKMVSRGEKKITTRTTSGFVLSIMRLKLVHIQAQSQN